jgi:ubiquinone/menaquinone biosynthesis C-methylase UbiE
MTVREYHLRELAIARLQKDPRHILPALPVGMKSILDLGCGAGQTLIAREVENEVLAVGLDIDQEALKLGREISSDISYVRGYGEQLPFCDNAFDVVISRVALPYTLIPTTLREIRRVLKPGGQVWLTLHPFSMLLCTFITAIKGGSLRSVVYQFYILTNSVLFHLIGKLFRYPLNRSRCESVQTTKSITRAMRQAGFNQVETEIDHFFTAKAIKTLIWHMAPVGASLF